MEEHNFFVSIKYGLTPELAEKEFWCTISSTQFDEDRIVESFREFIKQIKREKVRSNNEIRKYKDFRHNT